MYKKFKVKEMWIINVNNNPNKIFKQSNFMHLFNKIN